MKAKTEIFQTKISRKVVGSAVCLLVTSLVVFCVLISRHVRKAAYFAGKEHVE